MDMDMDMDKTWKYTFIGQAQRAENIIFRSFGRTVSGS
jgi:hypothetical protein